MAILATIAGLAVSTYGGGDDGVEAQARLGLVAGELSTLQEALVRFHRDTGWLPAQGPFGLQGETTLWTAPNLPAVPSTSLPPFVQVASPATQSAWVHHPANLWQLFMNPLAGTTHPLATWDPVRRRGWNGPYLRLELARLCTVPVTPAAETSTVSLAWRGRSAWDLAGSGLLASSGAPLPVHALTDPLRGQPVGSAFTWFALAYDGTNAETTSLSGLHGRPYLVLEADERPTLAYDPSASPSVREPATLRARVVCLGLDGNYGPPTPSPAFVAPTTASFDPLLVVDPDVPSTDHETGRFVHR